MIFLYPFLRKRCDKKVKKNYNRFNEISFYPLTPFSLSFTLSPLTFSFLFLSLGLSLNLSQLLSLTFFLAFSLIFLYKYNLTLPKIKAAFNSLVFLLFSVKLRVSDPSYFNRRIRIFWIRNLLKMH